MWVCECWRRRGNESGEGARREERRWCERSIRQGVWGVDDGDKSGRRRKMGRWWGKEKEGSQDGEKNGVKTRKGRKRGRGKEGSEEGARKVARKERKSDLGGTREGSGGRRINKTRNGP